MTWQLAYETHCVKYDKITNKTAEGVVLNGVHEFKNPLLYFVVEGPNLQHPVYLE